MVGGGIGWLDWDDVLLWTGNAVLGVALIGVWGSGIPALRGFGAPFTRTAKAGGQLCCPPCTLA